jgi:hypothetical protein
MGHWGLGLESFLNQMYWRKSKAVPLGISQTSRRVCWGNTRGTICPCTFADSPRPKGTDVWSVSFGVGHYVDEAINKGERLCFLNRTNYFTHINPICFVRSSSCSRVAADFYIPRPAHERRGNCATLWNGVDQVWNLQPR